MYGLIFGLVLWGDGEGQIQSFNFILFVFWKFWDWGVLVDEKYFVGVIFIVLFDGFIVVFIPLLYNFRISVYFFYLDAQLQFLLEYLLKLYFLFESKPILSLSLSLSLRLYNFCGYFISNLFALLLINLDILIIIILNQLFLFLLELFSLDDCQFDSWIILNRFLCDIGSEFTVKAFKLSHLLFISFAIVSCAIEIHLLLLLT